MQGFLWGHTPACCACAFMRPMTVASCSCPREPLSRAYSPATWKSQKRQRLRFTAFLHRPPSCAHAHAHILLVTPLTVLYLVACSSISIKSVCSRTGRVISS